MKLLQDKYVKSKMRFFLPLIFIMIIAYVLFDVFRTKNELQDLLKNEAENITESIKTALKNNDESANEIENYILEKLVALAFLTSHIEEHEKTDAKIQMLAKDFEIDLVMIIDQDAKIIASNLTNVKHIDLDQTLFSPVIAGEYVWLEIGYIDVENTEYYVVAHERIDREGIILCGISAEKALLIRKKYGVGALLQNFVKKDDIKYIILQDTIGIYAAAGNLSQTNVIKEFTREFHFSQIVEIGKNKYFEYNTTFPREDGTSLLTLAIDTQKSSSIQNKTVLRAAILILGIISVYFVILYLFKINATNITLQNQNIQFSKNLEFILNNLNDAVITFDFNTKQVELINKSAIDMFAFLNISQGLNHDSIFPDDEFSVNESIENSKPKIYQETEINVNETKLYYAFSHSFLNDEYNEKKLLMLVIKDITELKKTQELIQRKNRLDAMSNLAAGVAHEIRNPLNSISIIVQRFKLEFAPESDRDEYIKLVNTVRSEIERLNNIINQFLDYAKPKPLANEILNISQVLEEIFNLYKTKCERNNIELILQKCHKCLIIGDKNKLKQVIINIIQNAIDELDNSGKIIIANKVVNQQVVIDIIDNGKGIDDDQKQKIFDLYYTTKNKGNGIGLSIVQQIIDEHNGNISVLNNKPKGTIFRIKLPVKK